MKERLEKLQSKLIDVFLKATSQIQTKRQVEAVLNDIYNLIFTLMVAIGLYAVIKMSGIALVIFIMIYVTVMSLGGVIAFSIRNTLLGMLYPPADKLDENGDSTEENNLFKALEDFQREFEKMSE